MRVDAEGSPSSICASRTDRFRWSSFSDRAMHPGGQGGAKSKTHRMSPVGVTCGRQGQPVSPPSKAEPWKTLPVPRRLGQRGSMRSSACTNTRNSRTGDAPVVVLQVFKKKRPPGGTIPCETKQRCQTRDFRLLNGRSQESRLLVTFPVIIRRTSPL